MDPQHEHRHIDCGRITLTVDPADPSEQPDTWEDDTAVEVVGEMVDIGPSGTTFDVPIRLTFHIDAAAMGDIPFEELRAVTIENGVWTVLADPILNAQTLSISGTTTHLSPFGVTRVGCTSDAACDDGNTCTIDTCNGSGRCVASAFEGACDDGNACTSGTLSCKSDCTLDLSTTK